MQIQIRMQTQKGDMTIALDIGIAEQVCGKASDDDTGGGACLCGQACVAYRQSGDA